MLGTRQTVLGKGNRPIREPDPPRGMENVHSPSLAFVGEMSQAQSQSYLIHVKSWIYDTP